MLLCKSLKILVLLNPKTGSQSLRQLMVYLNSTRSIFTVSEIGLRNSRMSRFSAYFPNEDLTGYRIFAFYRDPLERFLSGMEHHQTKFPVEFPRTMSVSEYLNACGGFTPQVLHLNPEGYTLELFNFEDFNNEVVRMAAEFGYTINAAQVPKINESANRKRRSDLTAQEIQLIRNHYDADYQFFASKGITFPI